MAFIAIPVVQIEFYEGSNTIWVQGFGGTVLRIKTTQSITTEVCTTNLVSRADVLTSHPIRFCLAGDLSSKETVTPTQLSEQKLEFGQLEIGDCFIYWPVPGDNSGHGGYLRGSYLFTKTGNTSDCLNSGVAKNGRGIESTIPHRMPVLKVVP